MHCLLAIFLAEYGEKVPQLNGYELWPVASSQVWTVNLCMCVACCCFCIWPSCMSVHQKDSLPWGWPSPLSEQEHSTTWQLPWSILHPVSARQLFMIGVRGVVQYVSSVICVECDVCRVWCVLSVMCGGQECCGAGIVMLVCDGVGNGRMIVRAIIERCPIICTCCRVAWSCVQRLWCVCMCGLQCVYSGLFDQKRIIWHKVRSIYVVTGPIV